MGSVRNPHWLQNPSVSLALAGAPHLAQMPGVPEPDAAGALLAFTAAPHSSQKRSVSVMEALQLGQFIDNAGIRD
jgi:hypothetical protein